jgi:hypothetical protein
MLKKLVKPLLRLKKWYVYILFEISASRLFTFHSIFQVKRSGTQLSQHVYAFLTYVQTAEQETRGKGKDKDSSKTGNLTKVTTASRFVPARLRFQ